MKRVQALNSIDSYHDKNGARLPVPGRLVTLALQHFKFLHKHLRAQARIFQARPQPEGRLMPFLP